MRFGVLAPKVRCRNELNQGGKKLFAASVSAVTLEYMHIKRCSMPVLLLCDRLSEYLYSSCRYQPPAAVLQEKSVGDRVLTV
jgi:hypothetical protein